MRWSSAWIAWATLVAACGPSEEAPHPRGPASPPPAPSIPKPAGEHGERAHLRVSVPAADVDPARVRVALYRGTPTGALSTAVQELLQAESEVHVREARDLEPGEYVVRVTAAGRRTAHAAVTLSAGETRALSVPVGAPGLAVTFVLPSDLAVIRRCDVTAQQVGGRLVGDRQSVKTEPAAREWAMSGLSPGRYFLQHWDVRRAIVVEVPDAPSARIELPPQPRVGDGDGSLRVRLVGARTGNAVETISTVALAPGESDGLPVGVWMQCAYLPATFERLAPGTYTLILFDGISRAQLGWPTGYRTETVRVGTGPVTSELRVED